MEPCEKAVRGRGRKKVTRRQVEAEEEKREPQTVGVTMSRIV